MRNSLKNKICFLVITAVLLLPAAGSADMNEDKTLSPYFLIENGDPSSDQFPLKETNVTTEISGVIAYVKIIQKYKNNGAHPINASYIFPASTRAAVHGMTMKIGEEIIKARINERQEAQKQFDQAKKEGKSASLLKQQRPNVFSMNIANIMPGDHIDIELEYTELLVPTEGIYEFVYPTVVGPRYSEQSEEGAPGSEKWVENPYLQNGDENPTRFHMAVNISTGVPLQDISCRTHVTDIVWDNKSTAKLTLSNSEKYGGNRDFILNYRLSGQQIESGLMLYEGEDEHFFLLMAQPPERIKPADIPPREYIFVVDVSGSMNGFPLNTSKKLLQNLIGSLRPTDAFNVILFAGGSSLMADASIPATKENINRAIRVIDNQEGGGGTRLYSALKKGLDLPKDESFSRTMIIVTDGYISAEKKVFNLISENLNNTNVFSFGIGSGVNRYLIEGLAKAGQGEPFVVTKPGEARKTAERFRRYIESPVLTSIVVDYDGFETYDIEPPGIPDLFAKRPVIVFGKWRGKPEGTIRLTGSGGSGDYVKTFDVSLIRPLETNKALRYLWARTRVSRLSDYHTRVHNTDNKAEITNLGLTYNLLTRYTSFIAVHEVIRNPEAVSKDVTQPLPLPKHVSNLAVGNSTSSVPEPEMVILLIIAGMMITILVIKRKRNSVIL